MTHTKSLSLYKNGRKIQTARKSTAELRLRMMWFTLKAIFDCLCQYGRYLWEHNPVSVLSRRHRRLYFVENYGEMMIKPKLRERILDLLLSDFRRRQRLLNWVHARVRSHAFVHDFSTCWQDGTALCALLESICPGVCPSFHLLSGHNRVKNCRLGLKLANKYLYVPMDLISAEEFAIANKSTEQKIIQYISMVKWASENIKEKWSTLHESLIAAKTGRCFAKGSGLKSGIVDKRSKFTILVSDTIGVFNLLVEVRGPNHEYCGERIVSLHQAKALLDKSFDFDVPESDNIKYLEDCAGNTFVRKKVPTRYGSTGEVIYLDVQCGEEGTFYVTFVPTRAGMHAVAVKWQNHHVENSPFRIKVYKASNVSTKNMEGAQEKRVIYDSLSFSSHSTDGLNLDQPEVHIADDYESQIGSDSSRSMSAIAKAKTYSMGRQLTVTRRRVLRRIITRNGEDIIIEEAISPSLSRQSSITDNSDDDSRHQRTEGGGHSETLTSQTLKNHPNVLGTVQEERQFSHESDANMSFDQSQSMTSTSTKYKCTELDEHNRLDGDSMTCSHRDVRDVTRSPPRSPMTLFEKHAHDKAVNLSKRAALKRTNSIHHPYKTRANRASSDGPIYNLRRRLVSFNNADPSDTSSEISSEDISRTADDENDVKSHKIKLLHSGSLKKACLYICEKAMTKSPQSSTDIVESVSQDESTTSHQFIPIKTRLQATQSLPIMRRYWEPDLNVGSSVTGMVDCLENIKLTQELPNQSRADLNDLGISERTYCIKTDKEKLTKREGQTHDSLDVNDLRVHEQYHDEPENSTRFIFNFKDTNQPELTYDAATDKLPSKHPNVNDENDTDHICPDTPNQAAAMRANLTRQTQIYCHKSSGDSASVKTDPSTASEDKDSISQSSSSISGHFRAFKTIYIDANPKKTEETFNDITIVIPRPTIDKTTQVSHDEIKRETGWDIVENVYLLLRRICITVPRYNNNTEDMKADTQTRAAHNSIEQSEPQRKNSSVDMQLLKVPLSPGIDTDYPPRDNSQCTQEPLREEKVPVGNNVDQAYSQRNVNAWFERNHLLNGSNTLAPVRQHTMDTIDSGFDDNQSPTQVSRQGRLSLPNVLSDNGHTRIYRRPYRGPKIALEPSLVNSTSSQSISLDKREAGNEADDELIRSGSQTEATKHRRRRQRRIHREDSFSLSDSELNERRKRIRQRHHTFDLSTSKQSDSSFSIDPETRRTYFSEAFKALLECKNEVPDVDASTENTASPSENNIAFESSDGCVTSVPMIPKHIKTRVQTLTSVDSNYQGFGLSKSTRRDFLAQLNTFQNICPTDETTEQNLLESKITHWEDNTEVIQYTDCESSDNQMALDSNIETFEESDTDKDQEDINVNEAFSENESVRSDDISDSLRNSVEISFAIEDVDPDSPKHSECAANDIHSSTYFDIFSSFDHSDLPDYINPNDVAMLGDVISLTTNSGERMIMRVAGAGLRHGTVGENNAFQVWVENPVAGSLSVVVSGPRSHSVTETSVVYTGDNLYEVAFEVADPGLYSVHIKWGDYSVAKQPYICNVTM